MRNPSGAARAIFCTVLVTLIQSGASASPAGARINNRLPEIPITCPNARLPTWLNAGGHGALQVVSMSTPRARLTLAVATKLQDLRMGLNCIGRLAPRSGMLFAFPIARAWDFAMSNMTVGLDIAWIEADGRVSKLAQNMQPGVGRASGHGLYVVEVPAGEGVRDGLWQNSLIIVPHLNTSLVR